MQRIDKHEYKCETIVIGGGLGALLYSYYGNFPCIFVESGVPFEFDVFHGEPSLPLLGLEDNPNKALVWQRLLMAMSLGGLVPMSDKVASISIQDNNLKAITSNSRLGRFEFEKLVVFEDKNIKGLPDLRKQKIGKCRVIDWFDGGGPSHQNIWVSMGGNTSLNCTVSTSGGFGTWGSTLIQAIQLN